MRTAAATALSERAEAPAGLLDLLATGSGRTQAAALGALRGHGPEVRGPVIDWTLARLDRATDLRQARRTLAMDTGPAPGPVTDFLSDVLWQGERRSIARSLDALVVLGARRPAGSSGAASGRTTRRSGRRRSRRSTRSATGSCRRRSSACSRTTPPGLRLRAIVARPAGAMMTIRGSRALRDGSEQEGRTCPRRATSSTTSTTMLALRRVPLFEGLDPEDLQRIAATAVGALYPAGEALVREGDVGHELVVIVEGSVRVVHLDRTAPSTSSARYEPGDHIGELAVLREAPRAATVIAEGDDGVRGLVIGGDALKAILRERPDAAMAMLATLAERLSTQA